LKKRDLSKYEVNQRFSEIPKKVKQKYVSPNLEINPPRGQRSAFQKVTVTMPPAMYDLLAEESYRRKIARHPNHLFSGIIREAVAKFFENKSL
jgi:hypothetical protein